MLQKILLLVLFCLFSLGFAGSCESPDGFAARLPGDIYIGGFFPLHMGVSSPVNITSPGKFNCTGFDFLSATQALSMIYTIEKINNSTLLPGIKLGYEIYDTCSNDMKGMDGAMRIVTKSNSSNENSKSKACSKYDSVVKAVVGERYSEVSSSISLLFSLYLIPQISHASSASTLSNTAKYRSFLRTVPSDIYQTQALANLASSLKWNWVGIISSDDDYGQSALESLSADLELQSVCIAFQETIQYNVNDPQIYPRINEIIQTLENTSSAKVVYVISTAPSVLKLFSEFIKHNITRTWIASDSWSTSADVSGLDHIDLVGPILGFSFRKGYVAGFTSYLQNLKPPTEGENSFVEEYKELRFGCTDEYMRYKNCSKTTAAENCNASDTVKVKSPLACTIQNVSLANDDFLIRYIQNGTAFSVYLAVSAIAQAIQKLVCNNGSCENSNFPPYQLLKQLKEMNFSVKAGSFSFDDLGFVNGYDLIAWKMINGETFQTIGSYDIKRSLITIDESLMPWDEVPYSNCSGRCAAGTIRKYSEIKCCYTCVNCSEGYYSPGFDMNVCLKCEDLQWSNNGSAKCEDRTQQFFGWSNPFAIVLTCFSAIGFVIVLAAVAIFLKNLNTPAVKAAGGIYSCIMGVALLFSFISAAFFIGEPSDTTCQIRQTMYGVSFTLCVSCVLLKSLRILIAFEVSKRGEHGLKVTYQPALFIIIVTSIQIMICLIWLLVKPPTLTFIYSIPQIVLLQCSEGSYVPFGFMLGYIGVLAFICFALAFKGRKLPEKYNEARLITFSMLIYLFVWVSFIPVYVTTVGVYFPAVQVVAILASNYGIICCHFMPASYIIFFKSESNTRQSYQQHILRYNKAKGSMFSVSKFVNDQEVSFSKGVGCETNFSLWHKHLHGVNGLMRKRHKSL
ncbi:G-protein coupled receptor family C group 6 member A-like [Lissotriton helveticus]